MLMKKGGRVFLEGPPPEKMILDIPLDQLSVDPHQPRVTFDEKKLKELARSILNQGLQQNPVVNFSHNEDGVSYFIIKAGERRFRAHQLLTRWGNEFSSDSMECVVETEHYDGQRSFHRRLEQAAENSSREPQTHAEITALVKEAVKEEKLNCEKSTYGAVQRALQRIAAAFGKSEAWAQQYHTLTGLNDEFLLMLDEDDDGNRLNLPVAIALARAPSDVQSRLYEEARPYFARGHKAGYGFIVRRAREIRTKRGEKVRGRQKEEREKFMAIAEKLLGLAQNFGDGRGHGEYHEWILSCLSKMSIHEVDVMLSSLSAALNHFEQLKMFVQEKRDNNYAQYRKRA